MIWASKSAATLTAVAAPSLAQAQKAGAKTEFVGCDKVKVVDSSGAGDSFVGSLAFYLATMPEVGPSVLDLPALLCVCVCMCCVI